MHAVSYAFGREEEGTILGGIEAVLCECNFYKIFGEIWGIAENFPRFLKSAVHFPEERHLGLASLQLLLYSTK